MTPSRRDPDATKPCATCGRTITWRKRWAADWDAVRHCSEACRRRGPDPTDRALEDAIRSLLGGRAANATICPSEAARAVGGEEGWRHLVEPARAAARRLVATGEVVVTQRGAVVDASTAKGPIRIRAVPPSVEPERHRRR